jgi:hypothetical protein
VEVIDGCIGLSLWAVFLEAVVVPVHTAIGSLRAQVVQAHAFDRLNRVAETAIHINGDC